MIHRNAELATYCVDGESTERYSLFAKNAFSGIQIKIVKTQRGAKEGCDLFMALLCFTKIVYFYVENFTQ